MFSKQWVVGLSPTGGAIFLTWKLIMCFDEEVMNKNLADALLEVRELVASGSEEMMIIDEALSKVGIKPYKSEGV